jgi:hypothetical protein
MQIAARLIGESLKELPRQSETKSTRHVLILFPLSDAFLGESVQSTPDEKRPPAEIRDASRQTFVHRNEGFAREWISWIEAGSVAANSSFVTQCACKRLTQHDATIFYRVVCVHCDVPDAPKLQIDNGMFRKEAEHVVEKGNSRFDAASAIAINIQPRGNAGFPGDTFDSRLALLHARCI